MAKLILSKKEKEQVREWLKDTKKYECPFINRSKGCSICRHYFPKISGGRCPCHTYSFRHIIKVAEEMTK